MAAILARSVKAEEEACPTTPCDYMCLGYCGSLYIHFLANDAFYAFRSTLSIA